VVDVDEAVCDRDAGLRLALMVLRHDLQLAAIDAALGIDVLDGPLGGLKLILAEVGEGSGQRVGQAELDCLRAGRGGMSGWRRRQCNAGKPRYGKDLASHVGLLDVADLPAMGSSRDRGVGSGRVHPIDTV
jgi:hypothetical protein